MSNTNGSTVKLNQIVAVVEGGLKTRTDQAVTKVYHDLQKPALFNGFSRVYTPLDQEGETFPTERNLVQRNVSEELERLRGAYTALFDANYTRDWANTQAKADVIVDGVSLFTAPIPFLLFLKKQLDNIRTEVGKIPTLDPTELWELDAHTGTYRTEGVKSVKTRKVPEVLVKFPATDKHPAQTETYMKDVTIGHWETVKFSGAMSAKDKDKLVERVNKLSDAVKVAIEAANQLNVEQMKVGATLFDLLLG